ncbi:MAG: hypothetical protein LUD72_10140 [Bacteroidales bacterium]|nr:hypothetical protein [Bacteroidales bacterium]
MSAKRYIVTKNLEQPEGVLKKGTIITVINGRFFVNDVVVEPVFYNLLHDLIEYETNEGFNYIKEIPLPLEMRIPAKQGV